MNIERTTDVSGRITDHIITTEAENCALDNGKKIIIQKIEDSGYTPTPSEQQTIEWTLLGALRDGGIAEVKRFANDYAFKEMRD